jgi:hypothetical protein
MNYIYDEVHVYLDVFVALMLNWVFGEIDGTLIFAPKVGRALLLESKTLKGSVEATGLPDLHLPFLSTLHLLKKVQYLVVSYRP